MTLDEFFIQNPIESTLYNIVDVVLIVGLGNKLQFFDLHNQIRRAMFTPLQMSIIGSSALYDSFIFSQLDKDNKKIRCNIVSESAITFPLEYTNQFGNVIGIVKNSLSPIKITSKDFISVAKKYPGAYVKQPHPEIIADQTMIIDLDASLPPWEKIFIYRNGIKQCIKIGDYFLVDGDLALTWDDNNNLCYRHILGKIEHDWNQELITVTILDQNHDEYICTVTNNHSIFGIKQNKNITYSMDVIIPNNLFKIVKLEANDLEINDLIVFREIGSTEKIYLGKIQKIEKQQYTGKVYDISVEDTERFFAGTGIGVSNTSMYPSNIKQGNISFDTYVARIIPPQCYSVINLLKKYLGLASEYPISLRGNIQKFVKEYIENKSDNKKENAQKFYYSILSLFQKLLDSGKKFTEIADPHTDEEVLLLKNILIPLLDAIFTIHPASEIYNTFVYDYIYHGMKSYDNLFENKELLKVKYNDQIWVILNPNECNTQLISMDIDQICKYIQKYSVAFSGCMFLKHDIKKGLFIDMLTDFAALRKSHKKLRDTYEKGTPLYKFEDNNQNVFKRLMNTCYGLYGLSSFRYSDHWLARSITNNSLHALKCAIYKGEEYLTHLLHNNGEK